MIFPALPVTSYTHFPRGFVSCIAKSLYSIFPGLLGQCIMLEPRDRTRIIRANNEAWGLGKLVCTKTHIINDFSLTNLLYD